MPTEAEIEAAARAMQALLESRWEDLDADEQGEALQAATAALAAAERVREEQSKPSHNFAAFKAGFIAGRDAAAIYIEDAGDVGWEIRAAEIRTLEPPK